MKKNNNKTLANIAEQFGLKIIYTYLIPEETNNFWYILGGLLGVSLCAEFITGFLLLFKYIPDARLAFGITQSLLTSPIWKIILNFHYLNAFLIFILILAHTMRVFFSGAYLNKKRGLWYVGLGLAVLLFISYLTGEALHWNEVGFAVPWHISEILQAVHLEKIFDYTFSDVLSIPTATAKLVQIYSIHIAIVPILLVGLIILHFYLIKTKGISLPFWKKRTHKKVAFISHIKMWFAYSLVIIGGLLLISAFIPRTAGTAPQLLPSSPFYKLTKGPGGLGAKPSFPIGWTHGMNIFMEEVFDMHPDIWGTVIAMALMLGSLMLIPFVDKNSHEPRNKKEALNWYKRKWAFLLIALFWLTFIIGTVTNIITGPE